MIEMDRKRVATSDGAANKENTGIRLSELPKTGKKTLETKGYRFVPIEITNYNAVKE